MLSLVLLSTLLGLPAISCTPASQERQLSAPLDKIRRHGENEYFIASLPGVALSDLVDLAMFHELAPGFSFDQVEAILGPPLLVFKSDRRDDGSAFASSFEGRIEVVRQVVSSEGYEGERWFVRFTPRVPCSPCYIKRSIWQAIPDSSEGTSIYVSADNGQVKLEIDEKKRLVRIWWLDDGPLNLSSTDFAGNRPPTQSEEDSRADEV
jgi:hypothetical protein